MSILQCFIKVSFVFSTNDSSSFSSFYIVSGIIFCQNDLVVLERFGVFFQLEVTFAPQKIGIGSIGSLGFFAEIAVESFNGLVELAVIELCFCN